MQNKYFIFDLDDTLTSEYEYLQSAYKNISDKRLVNGKFYTILIIGLLNKQPQIGYLLLQDG